MAAAQSYLRNNLLYSAQQYVTIDEGNNVNLY